MNLKKLHGVDKFPAIYVTQSWRCIPGNGLRRAAPKLCSCLTMDGNSHLLCPWKHEGGAFISFSFICCHALSVHVIISITKPTAHVKYARAYPEKNKMRPWMMNNRKETFLNVVNTRSRFRCRWDRATTGHCAVTENETISGTWALNTAFIHCIIDFLRTSPAFYDHFFAWPPTRTSKCKYSWKWASIWKLILCHMAGISAEQFLLVG